MKNNIDRQIKKVLLEVNNNPKKLKELTVTSLKKAGSAESFINSSEIFEKLRESFNKNNLKTLGDKIREVKISGQDRKLSKGEQLTEKNLHLVSERELFIINSLKKILDNKLNLKDIIHPYFGEYVFSNYYRTMTELSIRIMTDVLLLMVDEILRKEPAKNKDFWRFKEHIQKDKLGLDGLKTIVSTYDKQQSSKIGLSKLIDRTFLFKEGEGFSLRNNITHEKIPFGSLNLEILTREIHKVNQFNQAFIIVFYMDVFGEFATTKDLAFINKAFE